MPKRINYSIIITGASSGIGLAVAFELANLGHQVFAGVRKMPDGEHLENLNSKIVPLILDVTNLESVRKAVEFVDHNRNKNWPVCLINNAGVDGAGPLEIFDNSRMRALFEVNFFGVVHATQGFLKMIRETKGRILNISTLSTHFRASYLAIYCASKCALEAMSDCLRKELLPFGVKVVVIQPGSVKTPIWKKSEARIDSSNETMGSPPNETYARFVKIFRKEMQNDFENGSSTDLVVLAVRQALENEWPKPNIMAVTLPEYFAAWWCKLLPASLLDRQMMSKYDQN